MTDIKLSPEQLEDILEVGNIGAGNAASRLSDLIHKRCIIDIPRLTFLDAKGIKQVLDMENSYVVALHIKIMGDVPALMFVIMKRIYAQLIVKHVTRSAIDPTGKDFGFTAQFALKQLGELLTRSFFDSINQFLKTKAKYAMPEIIMDAWTTALDTILERIGGKDEQQLLIHSTFFDPEKTFEGKFIYVLNQESQQVIIHRINLLLGKTPA